MNDNTILRIKVPAHLYESVKQQLTLKEAKGKPHYGAGMEVVKEKKMKTPKDGMHKVEKEKVEEDFRKGVFGNFEEWKKSFEKFLPAGKSIEDAENDGLISFNQEKGYMVAKDKDGKELGKWNPQQMQGMHSDDFQYKSLEEEKPKKERSLDELKAAKEKLEKKIHEMEKAPKKEKEEIKEYVGMSPDQMELVDTLGQLIAGGAASATVVAAAKTLVDFIKGGKKPMDSTGSEEPIGETKAKEIEESAGDLDLKTTMNSTFVKRDGQCYRKEGKKETKVSHTYCRELPR